MSSPTYTLYAKPSSWLTFASRKTTVVYYKFVFCLACCDSPRGFLLPPRPPHTPTPAPRSVAAWRKTPSLLPASGHEAGESGWDIICRLRGGGRLVAEPPVTPAHCASRSRPPPCALPSASLLRLALLSSVSSVVAAETRPFGLCGKFPLRVPVRLPVRIPPLEAIGALRARLATAERPRLLPRLSATPLIVRLSSEGHKNPMLETRQIRL